VVRGTKRKLAEKTNLKIVTWEGPINGTWYYKKLNENSNLKIVRGERPICGTW